MIALGLVCGWNVANVNITALVGGGHACDGPRNQYELQGK